LRSYFNFSVFELQACGDPKKQPRCQRLEFSFAGHLGNAARSNCDLSIADPCGLAIFADDLWSEDSWRSALLRRLLLFLPPTRRRKSNILLLQPATRSTSTTASKLPILIGRWKIRTRPNRASGLRLKTKSRSIFSKTFRNAMESKNV